MNWKGIGNWVGTGVAIFVAVFLEQFFNSGMFSKDAAYTALTAAGIAMWAHLRKNPMKLTD